MKASTYLNEYEIVNYNENYKYVLFISKYDDLNGYTENLDDTWNIWEWIIKKEINASTFTVDAKDLSSTYEWEENTFRTELFIEIDWEYFYGSRSEPYWYFDLTPEWKKEEVMQSISRYYWSEGIETEKIIKMLIQYKKKVWDEKFEEKMTELYNIIDIRIKNIIDKIHSEDDIMQYANILSKIKKIHYIIFEQYKVDAWVIDELDRFFKILDK